MPRIITPDTGTELDAFLASLDDTDARLNAQRKAARAARRERRIAREGRRSA